MTGIILAGHGNFASGIASAIELLAGTPECFHVVDFPKGQGVDELKQNMIQAIEAMDSEEILIMADILGGSPFNVAAQLKTEETKKHIKVITGTNMPSVVQAVFNRELVEFEQLIPLVIQAGKDGLVDLSVLISRLEEGGDGHG